MIRAAWSRVGAAVLVTACVPPPSAPHVKAFTAPPPPRAAAFPQPEFRGYRLAASFVEKGSFRDGAPLRTGALVGGLRVRTDASGLSLADSVAEPALQGGTQLPDHLGGGLLFWNGTALYTTSTFLGTLSPLLDIGFKPSAASFGPTFVLLRSAEGRKIAIDLGTRQRVAPSPLLLVDIASTADGRAVALLEAGKCAFSADAGKTYAPLGLPVGDHAVSVRVLAEALLVHLASGADLRLEKGAPPLVEVKRDAAAPHAHRDALWPPGEPPLERALRAGVPLGEEFAGVAVAGTVATVNLRTGELVQMTRALVPSDLDCHALDAQGGLLLACSSSQHGSIVLSDVFGEHPNTQAKFPAGVALAFAEGVLLAASRCDGQLRPGAVCVRAADGRFHDFDVSAKLAALAPSAPPAANGNAEPIAVSHWIPKEGGSAVAVVTGPVSGLLDAQSGLFVPLAADVPRAVLAAPRGKESWLDLDWLAFRDGSVRGWLASSAVAVTAEGRLEPSVYEFRNLVAAGAHALAFDKGHHAFQSSDFGHSWVETLAPPGSASGVVSLAGARCSPVGCHLGPWLRVGWEPTVPAAASRARVVSAPAANARPLLPSLLCKERAAAATIEQAPLAGSADAATQSLDFGASTKPAPTPEGASRSFFSWATVHPAGAGVEVGLRGGLVARLPPAVPDAEQPPKNWPGYAQTKAYSFISPFDPSARLRSASVTWRTLFEAARMAGAPSPALESGDGTVFSSLPVLGREPGQAEGLLFDDGAPVWVHDAGAVDAFSLGPDADSKTVVSAVATGPHTLALLIAEDDGSVEVSEIAAGKARRLFQVPRLEPALYPENADALALGPHGALAVLRTRSGSEPEASSDPAVLLDESGVTATLAPWSRLFFATAPECKPAPNDYRAVLQTSSAWLRLVDGAVPVTEAEADAGMIAMVRVNQDRICLEAVELAQGSFEHGGDQVPTRFTARFVGSNKGAARLGFTPGFELLQPLDCSLSAPR